MPQFSRQPSRQHSRRLRLPFLQGLAALLCLLVQALAAAAPPTGLVLRDDLGQIDAWPGVRIFSDDTGRLDAQQALRLLDRFQAPTTPHANAGPQRGAVWLALPLQVPPGQSGQWLLEIDYPGLQHIDVVQVRDGQMGIPATLGTAVPRAQWPLFSRAPLLPLVLQPGHEHLVLIRVASAGALAVPVRLLRPAVHQLREERTQAFQGLVTGLEIFLLVYALTQWLVLRDPMYLDYALANMGLALLFLAYFGLGPQHLWPGNAWLTRNAPLLAVFLGLVGIFRFVEHWLRSTDGQSHLLTALRVGALASALCLASFAAGLLEYRSAQLLASLLGPMPVLLALPVAFRRARAGSQQAVYMLMGWGCYVLGAVTLLALVRGLAPVNVWTQHAFQLASLAEMTFFMVVLGMRVKDMRTAAARAQRDNAMLQALAHTDPLTGLMNRRGLDAALTEALQAAGPGQPTAVFLLDLDGFKAINDALGHEVGDALLVAVGARLRSQVRAGDAVARLGGDEFVVVVPLLPGDEEAARLGHKLLDCIAAPFSVAGHECRVGVTAGYVVAPFDGPDAAGLLRRADAAMYAGKQAGRNCLQRGSAALDLARHPAPRERARQPQQAPH